MPGKHCSQALPHCTAAVRTASARQLHTIAVRQASAGCARRSIVPPFTPPRPALWPHHACSLRQLRCMTHDVRQRADRQRQPRSQGMKLRSVGLPSLLLLLPAGLIAAALLAAAALPAAVSSDFGRQLAVRWLNAALPGDGQVDCEPQDLRLVDNRLLAGCRLMCGGVVQLRSAWTAYSSAGPARARSRESSWRRETPQASPQSARSRSPGTAACWVCFEVQTLDANSILFAVHDADNGPASLLGIVELRQALPTFNAAQDSQRASASRA